MCVCMWMCWVCVLQECGTERSSRRVAVARGRHQQTSPAGAHVLAVQARGLRQAALQAVLARGAPHRHGPAPGVSVRTAPLLLLLLLLLPPPPFLCPILVIYKCATALLHKLNSLSLSFMCSLCCFLVHARKKNIDFESNRSVMILKHSGKSYDIVFDN
jgi:hypothetical protein